MKQHLKQELTHFLASLPEDERVEAINEFRQAIHKVSPFREEPVDCVLWVKKNSSSQTITTPIMLHHQRKDCYRSL